MEGQKEGKNEKKSKKGWKEGWKGKNEGRKVEKMKEEWKKERKEGKEGEKEGRKETWQMERYFISFFNYSAIIPSFLVPFFPSFHSSMFPFWMEGMGGIKKIRIEVRREDWKNVSKKGERKQQKREGRRNRT